ncbi:methyl-accepting chemotaxis protein [Hydrogenophaga pseudoflava]|uniref:methyl-accepting chemotaxis protein n=1 Tax=Hydrogenophaga pseudoflava TaxID=47421 RepID=UPI0027E59E2D|nr:methyl-accepting chemotaxis protein [Hydrogenophaga pseudoflava]MDQ7746112.1 methyl-accepting chemotaxis protein [Hydrogenophaga pseudoflava]
MHYWFQRWSIVAKLRFLAFLGIACLVALAAWQGVETYRHGYAARQDATRRTVEVAHGIVAWAHGLETSGQMDRAAAQALAKGAISKLRYEGNEYFWINDMTPRVVMHPIKPALDGTDVSGMKDPNGLALFVAFADKVRKEQQGFVPYLWPKPGQDRPVEKLSYVKGFEPWGWVIGSGIYIDDLKAELFSYVRKLAMIVGATLVVTVLLARSISRSIVKGLNKANRVAHAIAQGDISQDIRVRDGHDEVGQLLRSMAMMSANLRRMVGMVQESAHSMETAASEIAAGNNDLSGRTEQTASNLEQTAAAMAEINETVTRNAAAANQAGDISQQASHSAADGSRVVAEVMTTMDQITHSSRRIADITGVIDGIAFQTNILALNAAVEAARAGDHGRGFAVVASEVRSLATRSAEAAREIKDLISESVQRVESGGALVNSAGHTMQQIVESVQRVNELVGTMRQANQEQATGVGEVNLAVANLDQMTQQNSALVEESAAAAASLRDQATHLLDAVKVFKLHAA